MTEELRSRGRLTTCCVPGDLRERATGIEPAYLAWEASALPLSYAREACRLGVEGVYRESITRR